MCATLEPSNVVAALLHQKRHQGAVPAWPAQLSEPVLDLKRNFAVWLAIDTAKGRDLAGRGKFFASGVG
jgi:hypothetical protein